MKARMKFMSTIDKELIDKVNNLTRRVFGKEAVTINKRMMEKLEKEEADASKEAKAAQKEFEENIEKTYEQ